MLCMMSRLDVTLAHITLSVTDDRAVLLGSEEPTNGGAEKIDGALE